MPTARTPLRFYFRFLAGRQEQLAFGVQERALAELGYPEAQRYQDDHTALVERLTIMRDSHVCADRDGSKVHDFIAHWTSEHAKRCDPQLSRWASTRRVA